VVGRLGAKRVAALQCISLVPKQAELELAMINNRTKCDTAYLS